MTPERIASILAVPGSGRKLNLVVSHMGKEQPHRGWLEDDDGAVHGRLENFKFNFLKFAPVSAEERKYYINNGSKSSHVSKQFFVPPLDERINYVGNVIEIQGYLKGLGAFSTDSMIEFTSSASRIEILFHAHGWSGFAAIEVNGERVDTVDLFNQEIAIIRRVNIANDDGKTLNIRVVPLLPTNNQSQGSEILLEGYIEYSTDVELADFVEPIATNKGGGFRKRFYEILNEMPDDAMILDVGGGPRQLGDPRYINLDYSSLDEPNIYGDGCSLPFRNESIDFIYTAAVLEHVKDPRQFGKEIHRVLKPGGYLLANSAFMQPVHSEGQHFFNLTPYGIELVFQEFTEKNVWWETAFAHTIEWMVNLSAVKNVSPDDISEFLRISKIIDENITPDRGMYFASGVWLEACKPIF
jgi:hypothetical protein